MKSFVVLILACFCVGCHGEGVRFTSLHLTNDLPDTFKQRNLYPDESGILKYKLTELVGTVIYKEKGENAYSVKKVILKADYKPTLEVANEALAPIFDALVNKSAGTKGSYLAFAASLDGNDVATVSIRDRNIVHVDNKDVPWELLVQEAKSEKGSASERYWIQGAMLSSLDVTKLVEIKSDASGVLGSTFGVEGKVYNKQSEARHEYKISVRLLNLDKLADKTAEHNLLPIFEILKDPGVQKSFEATGIEIDTVRGTVVR
jgi:hypothetical protein